MQLGEILDPRENRVDEARLLTLMTAAVPIHDPSASCFRLSLPEGEVRLDYRLLTPGWVDFHHTFTPVALRGRGLAAEVVAAGLDWAAAQELRVVASCSYVAAVVAQRRRP